MFMYAPAEFANRRQEVAMVVDFVHSVENTTVSQKHNSVFFFYGGFGAGKTWLLRHLEHILDSEGIKTIFFDFSEVLTKHPRRIEEYLKILIQNINPVWNNESISLPQLSREFIVSVGEFLEKKKKLVILVDNIHFVEWELLDSLEEFIFGPLSTLSGAVTVIASNRRRYRWETPELQEASEKILGPLMIGRPDGIIEFDDNAITNQISKLYIETSTNEIELLGLGSGGYPGLISYLGKYSGLDISDRYDRYLNDILYYLGLQNPEVKVVKFYLQHLAYLPPAFTNVQSIIQHIEKTYSGSKELYRTWMIQNEDVVISNLQDKLINLGIIYWDELKNGYVVDETLSIAAQGSLTRDQWFSVKEVLAQFHGELWNAYHAGIANFEHQLEALYPAKKTRKLIGYENEYQEIITNIKQKSAKVIYVFGDGGFGKTRLIEEILNKFESEDDYCLANDVIDLFNSLYHQPDSLQGLICDLLTEKNGNLFKNYKEKRENVQENFIRFGSLKYKDEELFETWLKDYNDLEDQKTVILAFDTTEKLFYQNPVLDYLGVGSNESLSWLFDEFIPKLNRTIILLSGRQSPYENELVKKYLDRPQIRAKKIQLTGFNEQDIYDYWNEIKEINQNDIFLVKSLNTISKASLSEFQRFYTTTLKKDRVNPLAVAVLADLSTYYGDELLENLGNKHTQWLNSVRGQNENDQNNLVNLNGLQTTIGQKDTFLSFLMEKLIDCMLDKSRKSIIGGYEDNIETDSHVADHAGIDVSQLIITMALARKGVDEDLLIALLELNKEFLPVARRLLNSNALQDLSIIKLHKDDPTEKVKIYLHDAVYEQTFLEKALKNRAKTYQIRLQSYYKNSMDLIDEKILNAFQEAFASEKFFPNVIDVFKLLSRRNELAAEKAYYTLESEIRVYGENRSFNFDIAINDYYIYGEEAVGSRDPMLDRILETEIIIFWAENNEKINEDLRKHLFSELVVRYAKRVYYGLLINGNSELSKDEIFRLLERKIEKSELDLEPIDFYDFKILQLIHDTYLGKGIQDHNIQQINEILQSIEGLKVTSRTTIVAARAQNLLGYIYRVVGNYTKALQAYQESIKKWRVFPELNSEQANTVKNAAFVLAEIGNLDAAYDWGVDAKDLRLKRGILSLIGESYNVIGHINLRQGLFEDALRNAITCRILVGTPTIEDDQLIGDHEFMESQKVRSYLNKLKKPEYEEVARIQGLNALLLAEAYRRYTDYVGNNPVSKEFSGTEEMLSVIQLLTRAINYADLACYIFDENHLKYKDRLVEALIEKGCAYRDISQKLNRHPFSGYSKLDQFVDNAELSFVNAIKHAEKYKIPQRKIDAAVNLAWHYYYQSQIKIDGISRMDNTDRKKKFLQQAITEIDKIFDVPNLESYLILLNSVPMVYDNEDEQYILTYFAQLGKISLLKGLVELNDANNMPKDPDSSVDVAFNLAGEQARQTLMLLENEYKHIQNAKIKKIQERLMELLVEQDAILNKPKEIKKYNENVDAEKKLSTRGSKLLLNQQKADFAKGVRNEISRYHLIKGVEDISLALEYNLFYSDRPSRDMKRAMRYLHERIKKMNGRELEDFTDNISVFQEKYSGFYSHPKMIKEKRDKPSILSFLKDRLFV